MEDNNDITKWTIDDVLNPNSGFWDFTEDELYDYADGLSAKQVDGFFQSTADIWEDIEYKREDIYSTGKSKRDGINVSFTGYHLSVSSHHLEALNKLVSYLLEHGNTIAKQFETKSPVTGKTIYTYLFDINDKNNDKMSGYDYE